MRLKMKYKPKVKLLSWWTARLTQFHEPDYCISDGIWQADSVFEDREKGTRTYTMRCVMSTSNKIKVGDEIKMDERVIIEYCLLIRIKRIRYKSIYNRKLI